MALALAEARKGWGRTSPNPMVGAVVADGGRVVSKGFHARAGTPHAEPVALDRAGDRARGAVLYVTLEPCNHQGRTPPCTAAILASGVRRVVIGARDPNPHVRGGGAGFLAERGLDVVTGVLGRECEELNVFFNKFITTGRPYVIVKSAATLDGKLATREGHSRWVTGDKARRFVHRLRHGVDAILVGRGTVLADDPSLNTRLPGRAGGIDPLRIVLDTRLSLPVTARVFDPESGGPTLVACGPGPDGARVRALEKRGVEVLPLPLCRGRVELASLLDEMGRRRKTSLLIEGGAEINAAALVEEKIADRILFFFAPKIIGGRTAPTLVGGLGAAVMDEALRVEILKVRRLGDDWLFEARPLSD
ncbi:MAG: bifunctional diaminohydroxyphosphoribosylaminopyrimidine deaminase/5-amino-6-(5-phosphoribosylamino)uracil reductase RibD [Proteobacteria bacterium]|nr:bifunctional diaminohydroxyphosphoribosylaminopyrimidine deaminase/5-amino-6-(5-phosphoribosylamino)uracil reductase RibD [Pseudomonadota bacterium]